MAKLDLALVVRTVDQATRPLRRIQKTMRDVGRQTGLDRVGRRLRAVGRQINRVGVEAAAFGRRFALVTAGVAAGLGLFVGRYAAAGDRIAKLADRIGVGVEELQRLQFAFDIGGVSAEQSGRALEFFAAAIGEASKGTGEATEIFRAMGINVRNADGSLKTTRELFDQVADAIKGADEKQAAFAAKRLFGRGGMPMVNALRGGSEGFKELGDEANRYGLISDEEARRSEEFIDAMTRLKMAIKGVGNALGADLIPKMLPAIEAMKEWIVENRPEIVEKLTTAVSDLSSMFSWIAGRIRDAVGALKGLHEWMSDNIPFYDETIGKLAEWAGELGLVKGAAILLGVWLGKGLLMAIIGLFRPLALLGWAVLTAAGKMLWFAAVGVFAVGKALWGLTLRAIPAAIAAFKGLGLAMLANPLVLIIAAIVAALAAAAAAIYYYWSDIAPWFARQWAAIKAAVPVGEWIEDLKAWGVNVLLTVKGWWAGIKEWFGARWEAVKAAVPVAAWIEELKAFSLVEVGKGWIQGLWDGMKSVWSDLMSWFEQKWADVLAGFNTVIAGLNYIPGVDIAPIPIPGQTAAVANIPSAFRFGARAGSIFDPAPANEDDGGGGRPTGGRFGNQGSVERSTTRVEVDFRNMPRGARHRVQADRDADVEVTTGYALQGAQ